MTLKKTSLKLIIVLIIAMLAILALNIKSVYAVDDKSEQAKKMLDLVPDKIYLDINEDNYEKSSDLIKKQVETIWKENNINVGELELLCASGVRNDKDHFYKAWICISYNNGNSHVNLASKDINISYKNTDNSNSSDEQYIKKLNIEKTNYIEVSLDYFENSKDVSAWFDKYYKNKFNDNTIKIATFTGSGSVEGITTYAHGICLNFFKNGKLYDVKDIGNTTLIPVVNVSDTMSDEEISNYVVSEIKKHYAEYGKYITGITKGCKWDEDYNKINNIYTVNVVDTQPQTPECLIIIKKEKAKTEIVSNTDTKTNIKLDTTTDVVPSGTTLVAEKVSDGKAYNTAVTALGKDVSKFEMYDINLINNNAKIQPNGKVKVSIPVPDGYDTSKIVVYRVDDDGTKTKYDMTIKDGFIIFETNHFSNYIVAEQSTATENTKKDDTTNADENTTTTDTKSESTKTERKLDDTPKTGKETNVTSVISSIITIISTIGLAIVKKF